MTTTQQVPGTEQRTPRGGAAGVTVFAAVLMMVGGTMQATQGLVALVDDTFYVVGQEYVFALDLTSWGWVHLVLGGVVALAGLALVSGATWARLVAVVLASLGILANFWWMPYYPLWSLTLIAFHVAVIWAVVAYGRDLRDR